MDVELGWVDGDEGRATLHDFFRVVAVLWCPGRSLHADVSLKRKKAMRRSYGRPPRLQHPDLPPSPLSSPLPPSSSQWLMDAFGMLVTLRVVGVVSGGSSNWRPGFKSGAKLQHKLFLFFSFFFLLPKLP